MEDPSKRRLGRGLAALIGEIDRTQVAESSSSATAADLSIPIEAIAPNPRNPRRHFDEAELADLTQSIREHGIVQPVIVRRSSEHGRYEIIAGERRWRAARLAGLTAIPVLVRQVTDRTALELAIIENVQRTDLNPLEEAAGYQLLIDDHSYTQADLGNVIGKSRSHVANTLRLLKLPESVREMVAGGQLTAGHARTLVTADDPEKLARRIIDEGLSVRQAEMLAQEPEANKRPAKATEVVEKDADTLALEKLLSDFTGLKVAIAHKPGGNKGEIRIAYRTLEQLDDLCRRLQSS